ncbi:hypothetical protein V8G54_018814, partial [Vigna mungo]
YHAVTWKNFRLWSSRKPLVFHLWNSNKHGGESHLGDDQVFEQYPFAVQILFSPLPPLLTSSQPLLFHPPRWLYMSFRNFPSQALQLKLLTSPPDQNYKNNLQRIQACFSQVLAHHYQSPP